MPAEISLIGIKYGRLTIIQELPIPPGKVPSKRPVLCRCECGGEKVMTLNAIKSGSIKSCGCLRQEAILAKVATHRLSKHRLFKRWHAMIARCEHSSHVHFKNYGGRGISVCECWHSLESFVADMDATFQPGLTLERINNGGNYSCGHCEECALHNWPANVRWATPKEQMRNKRDNTVLTVKGITACAKELCEIFQVVDYNTSIARLLAGWTPERAFLTPKLRSWKRKPRPQQ